MARKKEPRHELAGQRLEIARKLWGKNSASSLCNLEQWTKATNIYNESTIRDWENNGIPESKLPLVADCFLVPVYFFCDAGVSETNFRKSIELRKENENADLSFVCSKIECNEDTFPQYGFDWNRLRQDMLSLRHEPVYGDSDLSLEKIYIPQEAEFKLNGAQDWKPVGSLCDFLLKYDFEKARAVQKPVLLFGDFGIGKTSFSKIFIHELIESAIEYFPVFLSLRELPLHDKHNLHCAIEKRLSTYGNFKLNQIDRKILFVLDGFDELNYFQEGEKWVENSFEQLISLLRYRNAHVLITSRPALFLKDEINIPYDSPMFRLQEFGDDQVMSWIEIWKDSPVQIESELGFNNLKSRGLLSIAKNPLLLFMIAQIFDSELNEQKEYSKGLVYKLFYDWTIRGKFKKEKQAHRIHDPCEYRSLLQNIAMVIFQISSDELLPVENINEWLGAFQDELLDEKSLTSDRMTIAAHFFKIKEIGNLRYIEFSHKSFREYLVAEKYFWFLRESYDNQYFDKAKWITLGRRLPQVEEIGFLQDLLQSLSDQELRWIHEEIVSNLYMVFANREFPNILKKVRFPKQGEFTTLYYRSIVLSNLAFIIGNIISQIIFERTQAPIERSSILTHSINYIYYLCHATPGHSTPNSPYKKNWDVTKRFMRGLDLSECDLEGIDFSNGDFSEVRFTGASCKRCSFKGSQMKGTDFSHADGRGSDFSESVCEKATFQWTIMRQVDFSKAKLVECVFRDIDFMNVDFSMTRFQKCSFENCKLQSSIFNGADIKDCIGLQVIV